MLPIAPPSCFVSPVHAACHQRGQPAVGVVLCAKGARSDELSFDQEKRIAFFFLDLVPRPALSSEACKTVGQAV